MSRFSPQFRRFALAAAGVAAAFIASFGLVARGQDASAPDYAVQREAMVSEEIAAAGVKDARVLDAMRTTPRHEFVPLPWRQYSYRDAALPIGDRQTISPPYVVAYMTEAIDPKPTDRVLEIGTGSGYQAAILSPLVKDVYTIEIVPELGRRAERTLKRLKYENVHVRVGDGFKGWPEAAPFDKIIVTCSPENIPQPLVEQLRDGGEMIVPVGERYRQNLVRVTKRGDKLTREPLQATLFVPMTGEAERERRVQPDPLHPAIHNGGFEAADASAKAPEGWHYLRNATLVRAGLRDKAPEGRRWLKFEVSEPATPGQALQGFAIDGRKIGRLKVSCQVRGSSLAAGPTPDAAAALIVTFYDQRRAAIANEVIGPWVGSFTWRSESATLAVPLAAREAILRIGLHGGVGTLEVDGIRVAAVAPVKEKGR